MMHRDGYEPECEFSCFDILKLGVTFLMNLMLEVSNKLIFGNINRKDMLRRLAMYETQESNCVTHCFVNSQGTPLRLLD